MKDQPDMSSPEVADWASLPAHLLGLCFRATCESVHQAAQGGTLTVAEAAQLLASLSPCRQWRAVALAEVSFPLRLTSYQQLCHPLLLRLRCSELALPDLKPSEVPNMYDLYEDSAIRAALRAERAAEQGRVAAAAALLSSLAFQQHSGSTLAALHCLPMGLVAAPEMTDGQRPLLSRFPNLRTVGLRAGFDDAGWDELQNTAPAAFFPPGVRCIQASTKFIDSLRWVPSWQLQSLQLAGRGFHLNPAERQMGQPSCSSVDVCLRPDWDGELRVSVGALMGLANCRCITLTATAPAGSRFGSCCLGLKLLPLPQEQRWLCQQMRRRHLETDAAQAERTSPAGHLRVWAHVLAPLFSANGGCLRTLTVTARQMDLGVTIHPATEEEEAAEEALDSFHFFGVWLTTFGLPPQQWMNTVNERIDRRQDSVVLEEEVACSGHLTARMSWPGYASHCTLTISRAAP